MPRPESPSAGSREPEASSRKALLLRVGTGGALGSIFRDGTFEYIPSEAAPTRCFLTYATRHVPSLAAVFPARVAKRHRHIGPDFGAATAMRRRESGGHTKAAIRRGPTAEELMEAV